MASRNSRIVTVCLLGRSLKRSRDNKKRAKWLQIITREIAAQSAWKPIDAVLLPAGFFRLKRYLGPLGHHERVSAIEVSRSGRACRAAAEEIERAFAGATLIVGLDSASPRRGFFGDSLVAAWRGERIIGLSRMIFPADGDTSGENGLCVRCQADDYASPHRVITLKSGKRALLCACYDMFALRALRNGSSELFRAIRYLDDETGAQDPPSPARRRELLRAWRAYLKEVRPDVGLACIHDFESPGRDSYWQRHGIAYASAALGGGLALGAAHFRYSLPAAGSSTLAACRVRRSHLSAGAHRRAHRYEPLASVLIEGDGRDKPKALIRLFEGC